MIPPRRIAMSGGGMKGIAHVGALEAFEERGLLRFVREYVGTSAGALMAFCLAAGYTVPELKALCLGFDFTLMQSLEPESMLALPDSFGLDGGENLDKLLRALLRKKGHTAEATFADLAATGAPGLRVYAVDIQACAAKEFSAVATPAASVAMAVKASMSIPFYFVPVADPETGHRLVDGGLVAHFPFHHLTPAERAETVGFAFSSDHKRCEAPAENLFKYIIQLYYSVYHHQNERLYADWEHQIVTIPCGGFPSLAFDSAREEKEALVEAGRRGAEAWMRRGRKPERRYSF
jgi:NTE family protein